MTENPIIRFWLWYYDMLWQYWPVWLVLIVIAVYMTERHFCKKRREWDAFMEGERKRLEELKRITEISQSERTMEEETIRISLTKEQYDILIEAVDLGITWLGENGYRRDEEEYGKFLTYLKTYVKQKQ